MYKLFITLMVTTGTVFGSFHLAYAQKNRINVAVSFYPLAEFTEQVGGKYVDVINITPSGAEPHDYEPTPMDIKKVYLSRLFIFNGAGVDPWAKKIEQDLKRKGVVVLEMINLVEPIKRQYDNNYDPHIWLDPVIAQKMVQEINKNLRTMDPEHAGYYEKRASLYAAQLTQLDKAYAQGLSTCRLHDIVTSHAAFGYLAKRYGFNAYSIAGLSPEEEPSPKTIAELIKIVREKHIKYIFFERLINPKLSETIAHETGAKTLVLDPIEGLTREEIKAGKDYISIMKENLANLRRAMGCE
jgi:zinc transport system substrate-binding protein